MTPDILSAQIGQFAEKLQAKTFGPAESRELTTLKNEILSGFKSIRFPTKDEKDVVWEMFQVYLDQYREKQAGLQQTYIEFALEADQHLERIEKALDKKPDTAEGFKALREQIAATDTFFRQPLWPSKEDRERAWGELHALRDRLRADEDAFYAYQREHYHQKKHDEWIKKQRDFLRMLEEKLFNQRVFREKVLMREPQHREFIGKLEIRLKNQSDFLERLREQREELLQKQGTADSPIFKARISDWIAEKDGKMSEITRDMANIREKIAEVEVDISLIPLKVEEVDQNIIEMEAKIAEVKMALESEA